MAASVSIDISTLQEGDLIKVEYTRETGNYRKQEWIMVGVYLETAYNGDEIQLSLRPLAGTATIQVRQIDKITLVSSLADRRGAGALRGDHRIQLPRRKINGR